MKFSKWNQQKSLFPAAQNEIGKKKEWKDEKNQMGQQLAVHYISNIEIEGTSTWDMRKLCID